MDSLEKPRFLKPYTKTSSYLLNLSYIRFIFRLARMLINIFENFIFLHKLNKGKSMRRIVHCQEQLEILNALIYTSTQSLVIQLNH